MAQNNGICITSPKKIIVGISHKTIFAIFFQQKISLCGSWDEFLVWFNLASHGPPPRQALAGSESAQLCQHSALQIVVKQAWCVADFSFIVCNLPVILLNSMFLQARASAFIIAQVLKEGQSLPQGCLQNPGSCWALLPVRVPLLDSPSGYSIGDIS